MALLELADSTDAEEVAGETTHLSAVVSEPVTGPLWQAFARADNEQENCPHCPPGAEADVRDAYVQWQLKKENEA
jgi:hypothetical protein